MPNGLCPLRVLPVTVADVIAARMLASLSTPQSASLHAKPTSAHVAKQDWPALPSRHAVPLQNLPA